MLTKVLSVNDFVSDFSAHDFLSSKGVVSLDKIPATVISQLLNKLDIAPFLLDVQCNRQDAPYLPRLNGWNSGKDIGYDFIIM